MAIMYTPGEQVDHYEIIRLLGHGGMNRVYLGYDVTNQQEVVLKFPKDDRGGDRTVFERYKREAEIGNRIHHPNVQQVLNPGEKRSDDYLVIEYIKGHTLRSILEDYAPDPLPLSLALNITRQICDALAYCHEKGVFHHDMKPENVIIQANSTIKIIDFGVSLLEGIRRITQHGSSGIIGTPDYMSPEQLQGERGTASSDIYAVGVMLYEMLCGHTPFNGENIFAIMHQHISQDPPPLLAANPKLSSELATVVMHAVQRKKSKRYKRMEELLHDVDNLEEVNAVPSEPEAAIPNYAGSTTLAVTLTIGTICLMNILVIFLLLR